jgi:hypothetical protein
MRIVHIEIEHFRGIDHCEWSPNAGLNCLIGPGDSTKTTILDALQLALTPRPNTMLSDADFYNLDTDREIKITITVGDLPDDFRDEDRYGLYLRGWNGEAHTLEDEPAEHLDDALSVRVTVDKNLEPRWSLFNKRIEAEESDPPALRYKDAQLVVPVRLGAYAERHLAWGRQSVLTRLSQNKEKATEQLAVTGRAARAAFKNLESVPFSGIAEDVQKVSKRFLVPVRDAYRAGLDLDTVNITSGGVALHDGDLPLRQLGTGSTRLLVAAIQRQVGADAPITLVDEIEHGLEPHRISRLLKYLCEPGGEGGSLQTFMTTHSVVTLLELDVEQLFSVRSVGGATSVQRTNYSDSNIAQRHVRRMPEAFLAPRVIVCEGRTELGLLRGLDKRWVTCGSDSFAYAGVVSVDGEGLPKAPLLADHLVGLGHDVLLFIDGDREPDAKVAARIEAAGGKIVMWPDGSCTETRIFADAPWALARSTILWIAREEGDSGIQSVTDILNAHCEKQGHTKIQDLELPPSLDTAPFRKVLGEAARNAKWFKNIYAGERFGWLLGCQADLIEGKPLANGINAIREWVDA